jgi:hypothetical protein
MTNTTPPGITGVLPGNRQHPLTGQGAEARFRARLQTCGVRDKMNYRLGEVETISGFSKPALLKMKDAGQLNPWRPAGYGWDCYRREEVVALL